MRKDPRDAIKMALVAQSTKERSPHRDHPHLWNFLQLHSSTSSCLGKRGLCSGDGGHSSGNPKQTDKQSKTLAKERRKTKTAAGEERGGGQKERGKKRKRWREQFSVKCWLRYIEFKQGAPKPRLNQLYERALKLLPCRCKGPPCATLLTSRCPPPPTHTQSQDKCQCIPGECCVFLY